MNALQSYDIEKINPVRIIAMDNLPDIQGLACAGMPRHWFSAMRLVWANDYSGDAWLEWKLWDAAVRMAVRHGWRVPAGEQRLRKLARLALRELAEPAVFVSEGMRYRAVGVGKSQWFALWKARYELIYQELSEWVNRAWRYIKVKLKGDFQLSENWGLTNPD